VANVTITKSYYQKSGVLSHQYCDNIRITNCILSDNEYSTSFFCSNETIITENVFLNNSFGVKTYQFNRGIISQNTFIDCGEAVDVYTSNSNIITNNTIVGTSEPPSGLGIKLSQSNNCTVADNTISDIIIGINIVFQQSQQNNIVRNTIQHCRDGLYLSQAKVNTIVDNIIDSNTNTGITLTSNAKNNIITNNIFSNTTGNGIYIHQYSTANLIEHNRIENNQGNGLYLYYYGAPNVIRHNIIRNNTLNGIFIKSSYQALIYHNIFMNQNNALVQFGNAVWDDGYPSGGNYWSNYTGVDEFSGPNQDEPGSDGIGDIPYGIPGDGSDRYPLMMMPE